MLSAAAAFTLCPNGPSTNAPWRALRLRNWNCRHHHHFHLHAHMPILSCGLKSPSSPGPLQLNRHRNLITSYTLLVAQVLNAAYKPFLTPLVAQAHASGCVAIPGVTMLLEKARVQVSEDGLGTTVTQGGGGCYTSRGAERAVDGVNHPPPPPLNRAWSRACCGPNRLSPPL